MTPSEAIAILLAAGWTETQIGDASGSRQSVVNRIKHGKMTPNWETGAALVELASRDDLTPPQAEAA